MKNKRIMYIVFIFIGVLSFVIRQNYLSNKWHRYSNQDIKIALEYPASWFEITFFHCSTCQYVKLFVMNIPVIDQIELRVYSANQDSLQMKDAKSFGEWIILQNNKDTHILNRKVISVGKDNYHGEEIYFERDMFQGRIVTLKHNNRFYAIESHAIKKKWNEANVIFDKILETFEFLE